MTTPTETKAVALPEKKRLFDLAGNHWETHGAKVICNNIWSHSPGVLLDTISYRSESSTSIPHVIVKINHGPFNLDIRLDPAAARAHADALLLAADRVDEVNAALVAEKAAAKLLGAKAKKAVASATKTLSEVSP